MERTKDNIEAVFPLSPLQQGMLFHSLYATDVSAYVVQMVGVLRGRLDVPAFEAAWQRVVDHHGILRTAFLWEGLKEPMHVVGRKVSLRVQHLDWRGLTADEQTTRLQEFLWEDRCRGFALYRAPLMRVWLIRISEDAYRMVWSHHHLLLDGWSLSLLLKDLLACYAAFAEGGEPRLARARPYQDYISWLKDQNRQEAQEYWQNALAGFCVPTPLLSGPKRDAGSARDTADQGAFLDLPRELTSHLGALCREHQLTINSFLQGAWGLLLSRYSGRGDVVFGSTLSGRPAELTGAETMLGLFINTVPVRVTVAPAMRVIPWLKSLQTRQLERNRFEYSSLLDIQKWSAVPHGVPLFDSLYLFENYPLDAALKAEAGSLSLEDFKVHSTADFPLAFVAIPGERLALRAGYARHRFDAQTARRMLTHIDGIIRQWVANPFQPLAHVTLLGEQERLSIQGRHEAAGPDQNPAPPRCLHALIEQQARRRPMSLAVLCNAERLTYGELDRRADALAGRLQQAGVGPRSIVLVDLDRSVEMVVALLAIWKSEAACFPAPAGGAREFCARPEWRGLLTAAITDSTRASALDGLGVFVVTVADPDEAAGAPRRSAETCDAREPAIVVAVNVGDRLRLLGIQHDEASVRIATIIAGTEGTGPAKEAGPSLVTWTPETTLPGILELVAALTSGGTVTLARDDATSAIFEIAAPVRPLVISASPRQFRRLVHSGWRPTAGQFLRVTGDWLDSRLAEVLRPTADNDFVHYWGCDEALGWATESLGSPIAGGLVGDNLSGVRLYVLDDQLNPAPDGVAGRLHIAGTVSQRGYIDAPDETASGFVPDPFAAQPGARMFRTTVVARFNSAGMLEILGSAESGSGALYECWRIVQFLRGLPDVDDAAVICEADARAGRRLVACLAMAEERRRPARELRAALKSQFRALRLPVAIAVCTELPVDKNGAFDRAALLQLVVEDLGADSPQRLVRSQEDYYDVLCRRTNLTKNQLHIYVGSQLQPDAPLYNLGMLVEFGGTVDPVRLCRAVQQVVDASDALRTVIDVVDGVPRQRVLDQFQIDIERINLSDAPDPALELRRLVRERVTRPFRLDERLFDAGLFQLADDRHSLYLGVHHLVADALSCKLITHSIVELYNRNGADNEEPPFALPPFADFLQDQREQLDSASHRKSKAFWIAEVEQELEPSHFYSQNGPLQGRARVERVEQPLDHESSARLREIASHPAFQSSSEHASLFSVFGTVLLAFLHKLGGRRRLAFGTSVANRPSRQFKQTIGCFMQIAPLHVDIDADETMATLSKKVRSRLYGLLRHQRYVISNPPQRPIYDVLFNYHTAIRDSSLKIDGADCTYEWIPSGYENDKLALQVHDFNSTGCFTLAFDFRSDQFNLEQQRETIRQFLKVLDAFCEAPARRLGDMDLTSEAQRELLLTDWGCGTALNTGSAGLFALIAERARVAGDSVAVVQEEQTLCYRDLAADVNRFAWYLRSRGVGPGTAVGVMLPRSIDCIVTLLGILQAGGAYVPLDPQYPRERLELMMDDAQIEFLVTAHNNGDNGRAERTQVIDLAALRSDIAACPAVEPPALALDEDIAYVIYTSGSTGKPKGVEIPRRALWHYASAARSFLELSPADRVLQFASINFDAAVEEIFGCLASGGCLVLRTETMLDSMAGFLECCREWQVTVLDLPTAFWHQLTDELVMEHHAFPPSVRLVVLGGEAALPERYQAWRRHVGLQVRLLNTYGPTETTVVSTMCDLSRRAVGSEGCDLPIGGPIPNTIACVLDPDFRLSPPGIAGELHLGGEGLSRGYRNQPGLTAERFIPDPFSGRPGARLYRTGDRVRWLPDGNLEFLGRIDTQVKIRGFRIEPGEIEAALIRHSGIRAAAVLPLPAGSGEVRLIAFYVPHDSTKTSADGLRSFLRERLPDYMVPAQFVPLDALPLTRSGKIDRRALAATNLDWSRDDGGWESPRTILEQAVARLWSDVLEIEDVGAEDNFFDRGGHSLSATQLVSRVNREFEIELPLAAVFQHPTVAGMARIIQEMKQGLRPPRIHRVPRETPLELSFPQQRLWLLNQLMPGDTSYNIPVALRVRGPLDLAALEQSFGEVVRRHEVLRTTITNENNVALQVIHPPRPASVPLADLGDMPAGDRESALRNIVQTAAGTPFPLQSESPIRLRALRFDREDHLLLLTIHHIAWDGWSMGVFMREMGAIYASTSAGLSSPLPELSVQYADYAQWQRAWMQGDVLDRHFSYWQVQLVDLPVTTLPADAPRPSVRTFRGAMHSATYPKPLANELTALSRQEQVTLFMTLLAAFQTLVARYTGEFDVAVGSPIANRNHEQTEPLIGFFVNTLVLRNDLSGDPSFRELLGRVRETTLGAYAHQDLPFDLLAEKLNAVRDPSLHPLFQLLFSFQNNPLPKVVASGELTFEMVEPDFITSKFDLMLLVTEVPEGLAIAWEYNTDLFLPATIERLSDNFQVLLQGIAERPEERLSQLPLLSPEQSRRLLVDWNQTAAPFPDTVCLHEFFEWQVAQTPEATAVIDGDQHVTYRELNERANRLARFLRTLGAAPNRLVGICLDRSIDLVAGVFAVLKAGAAYVPLDPLWPKPRLAVMLEEARVELLVSTGVLADELPQSANVICIDRQAGEIARERPENLVPLATPADRMYAIFTSGSTGRPKLAAVYHRGFANLLHWFVDDFAIDATARVLLVSSFNFDLTQKNLYAPLAKGGRLVLHQSRVFDPEAIANDVATHGITHINCTPSAFYPMVEGVDDARLAKLKSLRSVFLGGEPIALTRLKRWLEAPQCRAEIVNTYGPTECTDICAFYRLRDPNTHANQAVPLGKPIPNVRIYVLDGQQQPLPIGAIGELCIVGAGVGEGYTNDPALTSERFVCDPFGTNAGARLYHTRDLVRRCADGNLEYIGRMDHQVKVRGFRIELGEIEAALRRHDSVREALVVVQEDEPGDKWLAAYVVPADPSPRGDLEGELRRFLRTQLPNYLVPSSFLALPSFPLSPNGKLNRSALPKLQRSRGAAVSEYVAPQSDAEAVLCEILAQLLNIERVGCRDNFFELGGDSVLAIQVVAKARSRGLRVNPVHLFEYPTVVELAGVATAATALDAEQGAVVGDIPLLPVQQHFFDSTSVDPHHFNHPFLFEIPKPLDTQALRCAVEHLLAHHDALRLRFQPCEAGWRQWNAAVEDVPVDHVLHCCNLAGLTDEARAAAIEATCVELQSSLNLELGPLIKVAHFDLGSGAACRLFLVLHHLIVDAVSWRVLMEDLLNAYQQVLRGGMIALPPKSTSFRRWAQLLTEHARSESLRQEIAFWLAEPAIPDRPLPVDHRRGPNDVGSLEVALGRLSFQETDKLLKVVPIAFHAQINHVLLAALARALVPWLKHRSLLVELEGHGRENLFDDVDLSRSVGWFTSRFPVHFEIDAEAEPAPAVREIGMQLDRVPNRGLGYGLLRYLSDAPDLKRQFAARVQPEITFNYLGKIDQLMSDQIPVRLAPEKVGPSESPRRLRSPVFEIVSSVAENEFVVGWSYSRNLHRGETVETLVSGFIGQLREFIRVAEAPQQREYDARDFAQAKLTQQQLNKVIAKVKKRRTDGQP